ncbi:T9SS type A sorting domain-containing protein [Polaribacter aestuariivivens]|uniref:T9SS type A sorting domain-containing protein n=1 Tax=Polaribacter aestuariivivens TaxID=2304626 RepID=A0A5S3N1J7_9FLAO|nr:T9SS type A sorting domain-containing protein [Polaribacter aestuariivivens]TMM29090.1 T9SS type A sorting domain-containing protein [Polaribacter aestuariivivens]
MKKTTFLFLLLIPVLGFSQSWDFTNDAEGWSASSSDLTVNATSVTLTTNGNSNPILVQDAAAVNAETNKIVAITVKVSANGPTFMRASYPKDGGGRIYKSTVITKDDVDFKTYYIDVTNANWTGTVNDVKIHFKEDNGSNGGSDHTSTGETVEIDKISFISEIPREEKESYNFDTDAEGWEPTGATIAVSSGVLTITPTVGEAAKIVQSTNNIDATTNKYVHVTYKNNSTTNDGLRFQFRHSGDNYTAYIGTNESINTSSTDFEVLTIDLTGKTEWTGLTQDFQLVIRDSNNGNKASAGDLEIDSIIFSNNATLSTNEEVLFTKNLSIHPNPATDIINIKTKNTISKVLIFDVTGKNILNASNIKDNTLNISSLNSGIYFMKILDSNNYKTTRKLIKN